MANAYMPPTPQQLASYNAFVSSYGYPGYSATLGGAFPPITPGYGSPFAGGAPYGNMPQAYMQPTPAQLATYQAFVNTYGYPGYSANPMNAFPGYTPSSFPQYGIMPQWY